MTPTLGISSVVLESAPADEISPMVVARNCRALGLHAFEVRPEYLEGGRAAGLAEIVRAHELRVIYASSTALSEAPLEVAADSPLRRDLDVARVLGTPMLRIFPGDLAGLGPAAVAVARTWARAASDVGVTLVLENVGDGPGSDLRALAEFVRRVPGLRLNVDVGNAAQAGFDAARVLMDALDVTAMVHLKGFANGASCPEPVDFRAVSRALGAWNGPACFEQDAGPAPWAVVAAWVQRMRSGDPNGARTER